MKNLWLKKLIILLFISVPALAQNGKFSFTISSPVTTSAGVFVNDSILVRTLWSHVNYAPGTYTKEWDGKDDYGVKLSSPASSYKVKIMSNNVKYEWQGTIGNTSDNMTGSGKHKGYNNGIKSLAFAGSYGYFCIGYSEAGASFAKFNTSTPNERINITVGLNKLTSDVDYVCTDGTKVYWAGVDAVNYNNSYVFGTNVSDDAYATFSSGVPFTPTYAATLTSVIGYSNLANSIITGLCVQKTGNYLFVARSGLNELKVLNKTTGALVQTFAYTAVRGICVDGSDNLWMITGTNTVAKYTVNADGSLTAATLTLSGLVDPLSVNYGNSLVAVCDGSTSQQVKFFNSSTGATAAVLGSEGGYQTDASVNNSKFYFDDLRSNKPCFVAWQPDNSFWVNDFGNSRVQHYNSNNSFLDRIMFMGATYSSYVDKGNINKVFADYLEFSIDYNVQTLSGTAGWSLAKNWGANVTTAYDDFGKIRHQMTFSNGRTYGFIRKGFYYELVEFVPGGTLRFTGVMRNLGEMIGYDGSILKAPLTGSTYTYMRYANTGFDASNNPIWSGTAEILGTATDNSTTGTPASFSFAYSTVPKLVLFHPESYANQVGPVYSTGYHLGLMQKGANNTYLFKTEKSTSTNYSGPYPSAGWFECGNRVNNAAGGDVMMVDSNIVTSYHGEFWKNGQTNKFNHYYLNGLALGQFGTTRDDSPGKSAPGMAGNALTPVMVRQGNDMYLYHGDESDHSAIHRWKISGLNTISIQEVTIGYPSGYVMPAANYTDLMAGLPFNAVLANNTAGWTRNPSFEDLSNSSVKFWTATTTKQTYDTLTSNDITIGFFNLAASTNTVERDLGTNNVTTNWKIQGNISFPATGVNINNTVQQQFVEVLDANGKVLTTFYVNGNYQAPTNIYANKIIMASGMNGVIETEIRLLLPFEVNLAGGSATFTYGNYPPVTTTILDPAGNWRTPKTLRFRFTNTGIIGPGYTKEITIQDFKFYKDYSATAPDNKVPVANAGPDQIITLPTNSTVLSGSGTDPDGTINNYSWVKISGPATGKIGTATTANTSLINLVEGVYQYELTVTDNNGATGKDTVQVTVNPIGNQAPVASAGIDMVITLPVNNATLTGSGTDSDGTVTNYSWKKVAGPIPGTIVTANTAITLINSLAQGVYLYELTITDNNGAIGKDSVQVTVNAVPNMVPIANAGTDQVLLLPTNSTTLNGIGSDADGTIASYSWKKITGPASGTIVSVNAPVTQINNLVKGVYQFELTVTDNNGTSGKDTLQVTVNAIGNQAPLANAGADQVIILPTNSATLSGSGTDMDGTISSYKWIKVSGPASGKIGVPNSDTTSLINLVQGTYQFELTVTDDSGATGIDTVQVTVNPPANLAPVANAGTDQQIILPVNSTTLTGNGTDTDGTISSYSWIKISGPTPGTITNPNAASTLLNSLVQGVYQFELSVTDNNGATGKDTITVTVNAAANQAPTAHAGANIVITLPVNTTTLTGSGTDTDGTITSYSWLKVSGPSPGVIVSPNLAATAVNSLVQGLYEYELTVTDNEGAISKDTIQVTVNDAFNQAPVANAGTNKVIILPIDSSSLSGSGTDVDGTIFSYTWIKIAGPASGTIASPNTATTAVTNLSAGIYKFELTVTDDDGAISKDVVQVTVNAASNQAPVANAGPDLHVTLPTDAATLNGSGTDPDGTITSYKWIKIAGPAAGIITSPGASSTTISGLVQGTYQYQLMVTDNDWLVSTDTVNVTVNAAANQAPVVNAGPDQVITLPVNSATLSGTGSDVDGTITGYNWVKIAGPVTGTIVSPNSGITAINNLVQGIYQYELTVTDNSGLVTADTVQVTVKTAANQAPVADAGVDQTITLPANSTILAGSGTDLDGTITNYIWAKISGPSTGTIASPNSPGTAVNNLVQGVYQFELTVTDNNGAQGKDTVQMTVNAAGNQPPVALAGSDKVITLPINMTVLTGSGTDADGSIAGFVWVKISGPSSGTIASANSPGTAVNNLVQGVYQFELTVTDNNGAQGKDTVHVTVNAAANQPPIAFAGTDKTITLPTSSTTLSGSGTDTDGTITSYAWTKISGPATATIASANSQGTAVNNLVQGVYQFELTVTDNAGATGKDTIQVTVNAAVVNNNNKPPVVNAGNDIDIVLPINNALLKGTATDPDGSIVSYNWKVIKGPSGYLFGTPNSTGTTIQNLFQGVYDIEFAVTDNNGATAKDTVTITVSSPRLSGYTSNEFKVYPNPVRDIANLNITTTNANTKIYISVFDLNGKLVKSQEHVTTGNNTTLHLDMSNLSNGNYVVALVFDDGVKRNTMVVKYGGK